MFLETKANKLAVVHQCVTSDTLTGMCVFKSRVPQLAAAMLHTH